MPFESTARKAERASLEEVLQRGVATQYIAGVTAFGIERDLDLTMIGSMHGELTHGLDLRRWAGEDNEDVREAIRQARAAVLAAYDLLIERYWAVLDEIERPSDG